MNKMKIIIIILSVIVLLIAMFFIVRIIKRRPSNPLNQDTLQPSMEFKGNSRFALDQFYPSSDFLRLIEELDNMLVEWGGGALSVWAVMEPNAPVNGVSTYRKPSDIGPGAIKSFEDLKNSNKRVSAHLEFLRNDWAMEVDKDIMVTSPETGEKTPGFVRIKPEYHQTWKNFIKYYIATIPHLEYLQIDNEPENVWVNGEGYVEAVELAYGAVQEYNLENGTDIKVMVAGLNLPPNTIAATPEYIKTYMYENFPNIDEAWLRKELDIPDSITSKIIEHRSQKIHVILSILNQSKPPFDIVSIHNDQIRSAADAEIAISWYKNIMEKNGYEKPIWIDDMHTSYMPVTQGAKATAEDIKLFEGLNKADPSAIASYYKEQPTWMVRKSVWNFAAGAKTEKLASFSDVPQYFMPEWRYTGLFTYGTLKPKPAYYTAKILMNKIDYFETATKLQGDVYKFTFANKPDVYVVWSEAGNQNLDLTDELGNTNVKVTFLVNEVDAQYKAVVRNSITTPSNQIPLTGEPVFIEEIK